MAGEGFSVNPEQFLSTAPLIAAQAAHFQEAADAFRAATARLGEPWGHDKAGNDFAAQFLPGQTNVLERAGTFCEGLASIAPTLRAVAANTTGQDQANAGKLTPK